MGYTRAAALLTIALWATGALIGTGTAAASAVSQSTNVALVPGPNGQAGNGGSLTQSGFPGGYSPTFANLSPTAIRDDVADPLTAYDTVVLVQVCNIGTYLANSTFSSRIKAFMANGGKLLIWDSECRATDYSLFQYPFQSNNPGALGASGVLQDIEDNILGWTDPLSPYFTNVAKISSNTDAVGDANVFTSFDQNWCVDLKATNANQVNGPVQSYARYGGGLVIYDGLDMDGIGSDSGFDPTIDGYQNLARVWYFNLKVPTNGAGLPCGVKVFGLTLDPKTATNPTGTSHTVTATAFSNGNAQPGITIHFEVTDGPHKGIVGDVVTGGDGKAQFTYTGTLGGTDTITATAVLLANEVPTTVTETATKEWVAPPPVAAAAADPTPAPAPAPAPPEQLVLPARVTSGTARLYSKTGCVHNAFTTQVAGRSIRNVTFRLDGKTLGVVARRGVNGRYSMRIQTRALRVGAHALTATVKFVSGSATRTKQLRSAFQVCPKQLVSPQFTG